MEPLELTNYLIGVENFTLFIRVTVNFYETKEPAILNNGDALVSGVNYFNVSNLLRLADIDFYSVRQVGAVVAMMFNWECDLDRATSACQPTISLARLDNPVYNRCVIFAILSGRISF